MAATMLAQKRSWADIVKGESVATELIADAEQLDVKLAATGKVLEPTSLRPSARGAYKTPCVGEFLVMLGHYGWILPLDTIDHPDAGKTSGRIYVHARDIVGQQTLVAGDIVSFYLYADDQGLGAEACELQQQHIPTMNADAAEFKPGMQHLLESTAEPLSDPDDLSSVFTVGAAGWNPAAAEFVPSSVDETAGSNLSPEATEFVPSALSIAKEFVPSALSINPAFLSDSDSEDECSAYDGDEESVGADDDAGCSRLDAGSKWIDDIEAVVMHAPLCSPRESVDGSTSAGDRSGSDSEDTEIDILLHAKWQNLPAGWRPPPGLPPPMSVA